MSGRGAARIADVDNPHSVADDTVEDAILGDGHHPQGGRIPPRRIAVGEVDKRITSGTDAGFVGGSDSLASRCIQDFPAKAQSVQTNPWNKFQAAGHSPSFL